MAKGMPCCNMPHGTCQGISPHAPLNIRQSSDSTIATSNARNSKKGSSLMNALTYSHFMVASRGVRGRLRLISAGAVRRLRTRIKQKFAFGNAHGTQRGAAWTWAKRCGTLALAFETRMRAARSCSDNKHRQQVPRSTHDRREK